MTILENAYLENGQLENQQLENEYWKMKNFQEGLSGIWSIPK